MNLKSKLLSNTAINILGYSYILISSFVTIPLILANLGKDQFGLLLLLGSIAPLAAVFDLGIANAAIRYFSLPDATIENRRHIWQTSFFLYLITGIINSVVCYLLISVVAGSQPIFKSLDMETISTIKLVIPFMVFVNHICSHFQFLTQAKQNFAVYNIRILLVATGNTFLTVWVSSHSQNLGTIVSYQSLAYLSSLISLVMYSLFNIDIKYFLPLYHPSTSKQLLSFGLKNNVGKLVSQLEAQLSKYALGLYGSADSITIFGIPQQMINKVAGAISQFSLVIFPLGSSMLSKDRFNKLKKLVKLSQGTILLSGIAAILFIQFLGLPILNWWLKNPEVASLSFPILRVLSVYFFLTILTPIPSVVMDAMNYPQIPSFFAFLTVATELILFIILIPVYGAIGAAYSLLVSSLITVPSFLIVFYKRLSNYQPK